MFVTGAAPQEIAAAREGVPTLLRRPVALLDVAGSRVSIHSRLVCHVLLPFLQVMTVHTSAPAHPQVWTGGLLRH